MVKIALAGGSGNVAQEIFDGLVATGKHEILILSRKDVPALRTADNVTWVKADYQDPQKLAEILQGVHTVLSFILVASDPGSVSQKNLIDASVQAGVKRFAPSEWVSSSFENLEWYTGKAEIREYLKKLNADKKVSHMQNGTSILEYCLFQPGLFVNYFTYPYNSTNHITPLETPIDFQNRRALIAEDGENARITLITVQDFVNIVVRAIEYDGEWPVVGGINAIDLTMAEVIALAERVRGGSFAVEKLNVDDLKAHKPKASWLPKVRHPSIPPDQAEAMAAMATSSILLGMAAEEYHVSDEWNRLLPEYKFTQAEEFLIEIWRGEP